MPNWPPRQSLRPWHARPFIKGLDNISLCVAFSIFTTTSLPPSLLKKYFIKNCDFHLVFDSQRQLLLLFAPWKNTHKNVSSLKNIYESFLVLHYLQPKNILWLLLKLDIIVGALDAISRSLSRSLSTQTTWIKKSFQGKKKAQHKKVHLCNASLSSLSMWYVLLEKEGEKSYHWLPSPLRRNFFSTSESQTRAQEEKEMLTFPC